MNINQTILEKLTRIETKLDNVIKAMHDYDEGTLHCEYSGLPSVEAYSDEAYGESSFETFMDKQEASKQIETKKNNNARSKTTK
jgi:hypothetical protein